MKIHEFLISLVALVLVTEGIADPNEPVKDPIQPVQDPIELVQDPNEPVQDPIEPVDYKSVCKQGFSTNYFKSRPPLKKYQDQNIQDVYDKGFRNLRLRCRADLYQPPYNDLEFRGFLTDLARVVDKCLDVGVAPIISWIHHKAEAWATEQQRLNYLSWWTAVATHLNNRDYRLSFNLFTELGTDECKNDCSQSLRENTAKYNQWTSDVIKAIRGTGGKNKRRILILASPKKTAKGLKDIDRSILRNDPYLMAEWHLYASGPNKKKGSQKYWSGDGSDGGKKNVKKALQPALDFTADTGIPTYFGAWMAEDQLGGLTQKEVIRFSRFFVKTLKDAGIPWSLNVLDRYYETKKNRWRDEKQDINGQNLFMNKVLNAIKKTM